MWRAAVTAASLRTLPRYSAARPLSTTLLNPLLSLHCPTPSSRTMSTTAIPETMKGVLAVAVGGPEVLEYRTDLPVPKPGNGQVLVKNTTVGINYIDTYFRGGIYPSPKPEVLGRDGEGHIVAVGEGETYGLKQGDRVVWMGSGGYAEYSAISALHVARIPEGIPDTIAVASLLQGLTALTMIRESHNTKPGEFCLVHAAAGGVGLWLCQLLKALGARVIGTASNAAKIEEAKRNGAEFMIDYSQEKDLVARVMEFTNGQGVEAVFDGVGKDTFEDDLKVVKRKGTLVSFGNASGVVPPFSITKLAPKCIKLLRPQVFGYIATREEFTTYTEELFRIIQQDKLDVKIHKIYELQDVQTVHRDLEGRKTMGKLLMRP
ncbi:hypothetical protein QFC19_004208 [Naganishia cerealis]|uniref:Uncharacterized protein n=1 Tax=Naganishia cerealis TaxID=610337 RepID=A0ACC2VWT5_9TREE|nr:hypothetical protein QFC19_004208 [Naganishia cerealis]